LGVNELRELKQLKEENARLKQIVANLSLDKQMLQDVLKKNLRRFVSKNRRKMRFNFSSRAWERKLREKQQLLPTSNRESAHIYRERTRKYS
jgi:hypothetical protein